MIILNIEVGIIALVLIYLALLISFGFQVRR